MTSLVGSRTSRDPWMAHLSNPTSRADPSHPPPSERPSVLVVDDDPAILELLRVLLEDQYEVIEARGGAEAVAACQARAADVVLLDLRLPDCDGLSLLAAVRSEIPGVPVVILTGDDSVRTAVSAMKLGASDYLIKPVDRIELLTVVRSALALGRAVPASSALSPTPTSHSILLVGRDVATLAVLLALLEGDRSVRLAATVLHAVPHLVERPDILILDGLRSSESISFLERLREFSSNCIVILATDTTIAEQVAVLPPKHPHAVIRRPYSLEDMLRTLSSYAGGRLPGLRLPSNPRVLSALEYIRRSSVQSIRTRRIAQAIGVSPGHLAHLFRAETGLTIDGYLARVRIALAEQFMRDRGQKLDSIAELTGFSDGAHLSRIFKRYRGIPPGQYRRYCESA